MAKMWYSKQKKWCTDVTQDRVRRKFHFTEDKDESEKAFYTLMAYIKAGKAKDAFPSDISIVLVTHNVQEAFYMADKIFVLSARPCKVVNAIDFALDRPRDSSD